MKTPEEVEKYRNNLQKQREQKAKIYFKHGWIKNEWNLPWYTRGHHWGIWILEKLYELGPLTTRQLELMGDGRKIGYAIKRMVQRGLIIRDTLDNKWNLSDFGFALTKVIYDFAPKEEPPKYYSGRDIDIS